jgi:hypothetical protein
MHKLINNLAAYMPLLDQPLQLLCKVVQIYGQTVAHDGGLQGQATVIVIPHSILQAVEYHQLLTLVQDSKTKEKAGCERNSYLPKALLNCAITEAFQFSISHSLGTHSSRILAVPRSSPHLDFSAVETRVDYTKHTVLQLTVTAPGVQPVTIEALRTLLMAFDAQTLSMIRKTYSLHSKRAGGHMDG